jgi:hypothetical protein
MIIMVKVGRVNVNYKDSVVIEIGCGLKKEG